MNATTFLRVRTAVLLAGLGLMTACGGSGDGGASLAPVLAAGPFKAIAFHGLHGAPEDLRTYLGTFASNGVDHIDDTGGVVNDNGVVGPESGTGPFPYTLTADGVLSVQDSLGGPLLRGGVVRGGDILALASVWPVDPSNTLLSVALRRRTGLSGPALNGDYHDVWFGAAGGGHFSIVGTAHFDGAGGLVLGTIFNNQDGVITSVSSSVPSYTESDDGALSLGGVFRGQVSADGQVAIASGGFAAGFFPAIWMFVRKATSASTAGAAGTFTIVGISYDLLLGKYVDYTGSVTTDGAGSCTASLTLNREGVVATQSDTGTYAVAADGTLTVSLAGSGETLQGAISPDGRFGMLGGGTTAGNDPSFAVLLRR